MQSLPLPQWCFFLLAIATLAMAVQLIPHRVHVHTKTAAPWWDLPARMVVVTTLVLSLAAGVLARFPTFGTILAVFATA